MRFYCNNHQRKAARYIQALQRAGYSRTSTPGWADFALFDHDLLARARDIDQFGKSRKPVFLYPHTTQPFVLYDGMYEPSRYVTAMFTIGKGQMDVMRAYGFNARPLHAVGWSLCEIKKFKPVEDPVKVLFAPIHPNGNGFLTNRQRKTNRDAFSKLVDILDHIELTVRHLHNLSWNSLWEVPGVTYIEGEADQSHLEIDEADVVISHQTMAYMAIARGKPTLMLNEHQPPISGNTEGSIKTVASWEKYRDILQFPHDFLAEGDPMTLIREAARSDEKIREWRSDFIGFPFREKLFISKVERYLQGML